MKKSTVAKMVAAGAVSAAMFLAAGQTDAVAEADESITGSISAPTRQVERIHMDQDDVLSEEEYSRRVRKQKARAGASSIRDSVLSAGVLMLTAGLKVVMKLIGSVAARLLGAGITGMLGFIGDVVINFAIIALLFSLAFRIMFPGRSLRELWTVKNVLIMLASSVGIEVVRYLLAIFSSRAYFISEMISCIMTLSIVGYAYYRVFRLEGTFASVIKKALSSRTGIFMACGLSFGSVFAVLVRTFFSGIRRFAAFSQMSFVFILALMVVICGIRLFRPMRRIMLISENKYI